MNRIKYKRTLWLKGNDKNTKMVIIVLINYGTNKITFSKLQITLLKKSIWVKNPVCLIYFITLN